jgi:hypothetical protein
VASGKKRLTAGNVIIRSRASNAPSALTPPLPGDGDCSPGTNGGMTITAMKSIANRFICETATGLQFSC